MNNLFDIVDGKVVLNADELSIPVFKNIYDSDKTKDKQDALNKISYIIYMYKWNSPYMSYLDDNMRHSIICKDIFNNESWQPDALTKTGIDRFKDFQNTLSLQFLQSNVESIKKLMDFNNRVNWDDTDKSGRLMYSNKDLVANVKDAGNMLKSLHTLMEQVRKEELETSRIRGGNEINIYEDAHSMSSIQR